MAKRKKQTTEKPDLTALDDRILETGKLAFAADMTRLAGDLKDILDRHLIPITGKLDIDQRNQVKNVITEFLFSVFDRSDDDDAAGHRPAVFDYNYTSKLPPAFWELMQIRLSSAFVDEVNRKITDDEFDRLIPRLWDPDNVPDSARVSPSRPKPHSPRGIYAHEF